MIQYPRAIALYQPMGRLYFSDWGTHPHIGVMGMDGSDSKILLDNSPPKDGTRRVAPMLGWPNDIIIDRLSNDGQFEGDWSPSPMVYFCDAKFDYIARTNLEFTEFHKIFVHGKGDAHVFSISLYEEFIYFADWKNNKRIYRIHKYCDDDSGGKLCTPEAITKTTSDKPMAVVVVSPRLQPPLPDNPCPANHCADNQLCLLKPNEQKGVQFRV